MNDLVSIIIPFYNAEKYLERAVKSIYNQTYNNIELILINDGSTDNSLTIAKQFAEFYPETKLISIQNSGPGVARNIGLENARGKYIAFLDSDDFMKNDALEKMIAAIKKDMSDLVIGQYEMRTENNFVFRTSIETNQLISKSELLELFFNYKIHPVPWGKLFLKEKIGDIRFPEIILKDDDVFLLKYIAGINKISIIKDIVVENHIVPTSLTRKPVNCEILFSVKKSFDIQQKIFDSPEIKNNLIKMEIRAWLQFFLTLNIDKYLSIQNYNLTKKCFNSIIQKSFKGLLKVKHYKSKLILVGMFISTLWGHKLFFTFWKIFKKNDIEKLKIIKG